MRIKYDFEDDYKDIDLGQRLNRMLYFPKRLIEHKLQSIKTEIELEEIEDKSACILIGGIKEDNPSISINNYSISVKKKIDKLFTENDKLYILNEMEELVIHFRNGL